MTGLGARFARDGVAFPLRALDAAGGPAIAAPARMMGQQARLQAVMG